MPDAAVARDGWGQGTGAAAISLLVVLHFLFLACFFEPAISTPDANGYLARRG